MFSGITKSLGLTKVSDEQHDKDMKKAKKGPYSLPSEENGDPKAVYCENRGKKYRISTIQDFIDFRNICNESEGWTEKHRTDKIVVFDKPPKAGSLGESLNEIKVVNTFPHIKAAVLYDCLHDPDFRKTWDDKMIEGFNICQLDPRNDIGYYSVAFPWPLASREFINMRCWMEFDNGDFIIFNRTVLHNDYPCHQKHVRGISYKSGYYIQPLNGSDPNAPGCRMTFFTHGDVQGNIPHSLINMTYTKATPTMMSKLEQNAERYSEWVKEIGRDMNTFVPIWRTTVVYWEAEKNVDVNDAVVKHVLAAVESFGVLASPVAAAEGAVDSQEQEQSGEAEEDCKTKIGEIRKNLLEISSLKENKQFVGLVQDAFDFLDREYEKKKPTSMKDFATRLRSVVAGVKKTTSLS